LPSSGSARWSCVKLKLFTWLTYLNFALDWTCVFYPKQPSTLPMKNQMINTLHDEKLVIIWL
jgi:hypothetical protein